MGGRSRTGRGRGGAGDGGHERAPGPGDGGPGHSGPDAGSDGGHGHARPDAGSDGPHGHGHPDGGDHRHAEGHSHPHGHPDGGDDRHAEGHSHLHPHGHSHGLVDPSIKRSRAGLRAVSLSLLVLGLTTAAQATVFVASGSIALLADLIHNGGDALTAVPLGIAFALRSRRAEEHAGLAVVAAIFVSACVAGVEAVRRLFAPAPPDHLGALAIAGAVGYAGNAVAALVRTRAGRRLGSAALVADGDHARADAYVSLAVVASAAAVAAGAPIADPLIGLGITLVILRITWRSWATVRGHEHAHAH